MKQNDGSILIQYTQENSNIIKELLKKESSEEFIYYSLKITSG